MSNGETGGPYLAAAVLCEKVLQEKDGILSPIRIIDRMTLTASGPRAPDQMPSVPVNVTALLMFKSGDAKGSRTVKLQPVSPSGFRSPEVAIPILLEGDDRGANLILNVRFQAQEEGVFWFDVFVNNDLVTRIPLRLVYQKMSVGQSGGTPVH